mmetsp:Transcript_81245/g.235616  ORF Transcript_81245/g.235616 Transcript_81245/m.235616 type:complete len:235 (-) Transcript_81245:144-848(-)
MLCCESTIQRRSTSFFAFLAWWSMVALRRQAALMAACHEARVASDGSAVDVALRLGLRWRHRCLLSITLAAWRANALSRQRSTSKRRVATEESPPPANLERSFAAAADGSEAHRAASMRVAEVFAEVSAAASTLTQAVVQAAWHVTESSHGGRTTPMRSQRTSGGSSTCVALTSPRCYDEAEVSPVTPQERRHPYERALLEKREALLVAQAELRRRECMVDQLQSKMRFMPTPR